MFFEKREFSLADIEKWIDAFLKQETNPDLLRTIEKSQLSFHSFAAAAQCTMIQLSKLLFKNKTPKLFKNTFN